ncbi:hypothetical protein D9619_002454 [Psilocybe cf. subviscida]|uniref:Uncharacterized protein n=1 Tax=Psilocybe cf. subviscida TaxID=2480587 RepID=A0A8H5AWT2_9AGAR|nr:hypothetical protein D9619_002454 [Psilocybe cf. subviscida]
MSQPSYLPLFFIPHRTMFTTTLKYLNLFILPNPSFEIPPSEEDPIYHIHPRKSDKDSSFISPFPIPVSALSSASLRSRSRSRRHTQTYARISTHTRDSQKASQGVTRKPASRKAEERARRRNTICGGALDSPSYVAISYESLSASEKTSPPAPKRAMLRTDIGAGNALTSDDPHVDGSARSDTSVNADIDRRVKVQIQTPALRNSPSPARARGRLTNDIAALYSGDYNTQKAKDKGKEPACPSRTSKGERRVSAPPVFGAASSFRRVSEDRALNGQVESDTLNLNRNTHHVISPASAMYALPHSQQLIVLPPPTAVKTRIEFLSANSVVKSGSSTAMADIQDNLEHEQQQALMSQGHSPFGNVRSIVVPLPITVPVAQRSQNNSSPSKMHMFELDLSPIPESDSRTFSEPSGASETNEGDGNVNVNVNGKEGVKLTQGYGQSMLTLSGKSSGSSSSYGELLEGGSISGRSAGKTVLSVNHELASYHLGTVVTLRWGTDYYNCLSYYGAHSELVRGGGGGGRGGRGERGGERGEPEYNFHVPFSHEHQHAQPQYSTRNYGEFAELELQAVHAQSDDRYTEADDSLVIPGLTLTIPSPDFLDYGLDLEESRWNGNSPDRVQEVRVGRVLHDEHEHGRDLRKKQQRHERRRSTLVGLGRAALDKIALLKILKTQKIPRTQTLVEQERSCPTVIDEYVTQNYGQFGELQLEDLHAQDDQHPYDSLVIPELTLAIPTPEVYASERFHDGDVNRLQSSDGRVERVVYDENEQHDLRQKQEKRERQERCRDDQHADGDSLMIPELTLTIPTPEVDGSDQFHRTDLSLGRLQDSDRDGRVGRVVYDEHGFRAKENRWSTLAGFLGRTRGLGRTALDKVLLLMTLKTQNIPREQTLKQECSPNSAVVNDYEHQQPLGLFLGSGGASALESQWPRIPSPSERRYTLRTPWSRGTR